MSPLRRSVNTALWAMCAADSMAMPVHWYYNIDDIHKDFGGWICGFMSPRDRHPSSILNLSNTAGSGRTAWSSGSKPPDVVGNVILHDKLDLWKNSRGSVHYHQGLQSGDNTLNVLCSLRVFLSLVSGCFSDVSRPEARAAVMSDYVSFLTTPGSHRDSYAESFHRDFFSSWQDARPTSPSEVLVFAEQRSRNKLSSPSHDSQLDAIGCLPMILPFILLSASANEDLAVSAAVEFVKLTHPHPKVPEYVSIYCRVLHAVLGGASVRQEAERALRRLEAWEESRSYARKAARFPRGSDQQLGVHQSAVSYLGLACYTKGALSSLFYLAHEFHDDITGGILANANCGDRGTSKGSIEAPLLKKLTKESFRLLF
ncbi:uncharacterized protein AB9W97_008555 isoform 2-T2 [Spinachia spinachia]